MSAWQTVPAAMRSRTSRTAQTYAVASSELRHSAVRGRPGRARRCGTGPAELLDPDCRDDALEGRHDRPEALCVQGAKGGLAGQHLCDAAGLTTGELATSTP
jgi:hypothetical protein